MYMCIYIYIYIYIRDNDINYFHIYTPIRLTTAHILEP